MYLDHFYVHELKPLSEDSACKLLDHLPMNLSDAEKRSIANLTGEMPLALQIIGSLIEAKIYNLTPTKIIDELGKSPISFLSPLRLTKKLNLSITLSYNHLDYKTKKVGKYLSYFPGSFDQTAALSILKHISTSGKETDFFGGGVNELVARSLLELDRSTKCYHFHKLIKEFFLSHSNPLEEKNFIIAFQKYFGEKLCNMTSTYIKSSKSALTSLHKEQHNMKFLIDSIPNPVNHTSSYYTNAIQCLTFAVKMKYLSLLFTTEELVVPMKRASMIFYRELLGTKKANREHVKTVYKLFVKLTVNLAALLAKDSLNEAIQQYVNAFVVVEKVNFQDASVKKLYIDFYSSLLSYKIALDETVIKLCHDRILSKGRQSHGSSLCINYDTGLTYFNSEKYEESAYFLEKVHGESCSSIPVQVDSLLKCRKCYTELQNNIKLEETNEQLKSMFVPMMNQSLSLVYGNSHTYSEYYRFLGSVSEVNKSEAIIERLIKSFYDLKVQDGASMLPSLVAVVREQLDLALQLSNDNKYSKAAKVLYHVLDLMNVDVKGPKTAMQNLQLKVHCYASSLANCFDSREAEMQSINTMKFILAHNLTSEPCFSETCMYLIQLGNFEYLRVCYFPDYTKTLETIAAIGTILARATFQLRFQEQPLMEFPLTTPYIVMLDPKSKKVEKDRTTMSISIIPCSTASPAILVLNYIMTPGVYTSNKCALFIMNVIAVFIKIVLVYYVSKCILKCTYYLGYCCCYFIPCCCCHYLYFLAVLLSN